MASEDEPDSTGRDRSAAAQISPEMAARFEALRRVSDADVEELTLRMSSAKVQVGRLIMEQRDLQTKIRQNTEQIEYNKQAAAAATDAVREMRLDLVKKCVESGERLVADLQSYQKQAEAIIDRIRSAEVELDVIRWGRQLVRTFDSMTDLDESLRKLNAGGAVDAAGEVATRQMAMEMERRWEELKPVLDAIQRSGKPEAGRE